MKGRRAAGMHLAGIELAATLPAVGDVEGFPATT